MATKSVIDALRRLADDLDRGRWNDWTANMTNVAARGRTQSDGGECELDNFRHFRVGDEVTMTLVLTAPYDTP